MISRLHDAPTEPLLEDPPRRAHVYVGPGVPEGRAPNTIPPEAPDSVPNDWDALPMPERESQPAFIVEAQTAEPAHLRHLLPEVEAHPLEAEVQFTEEEPRTMDVDPNDLGLRQVLALESIARSLSAMERSHFIVADRSGAIAGAEADQAASIRNLLESHTGQQIDRAQGGPLDAAGRELCSPLLRALGIKDRAKAEKIVTLGVSAINTAWLALNLWLMWEAQP